MSLAVRLDEPARLRHALLHAEGAVEEYRRLSATHRIVTATHLRDRLRAELGES